MAAAAYKVVLSVQMADGTLKSIPMGGSDVNAAAWTYPSAGTEVQISPQACIIKDIIYSAAGTDTSSVDVYVNGVYTSYRIINAANVYSVLNRQVMQTPIGISAGAVVKFIQNT